MSNTQQASGNSELKRSLEKRFYEPILLLDALQSIYLGEDRVTEPDLEAPTGKSPQQIFFCFANKLSQICDNRPRQDLGATVTAFAILDSGTVEYWFTSNQRDQQELNIAKDFVEGILNLLGSVPDEQLANKSSTPSIFSDILQRILIFNRPRIELYLSELCGKDGETFPWCIKYARREDSSEGACVADALEGLKPHVEAVQRSLCSDSHEFTKHAESLLRCIDAHYPCLDIYMKKKTRGENYVRDSRWSELRHFLSRLLSLFIAVRVLINARELWPQLFVNFIVKSLPSTEPAPAPVVRRNANGIISRMGSETATRPYKLHAETLQKDKNLDQRIAQRAHPKKFRPIVHAEVNLLDQILRRQAQSDLEEDDGVRFFNEAEFGRYIGTSKPTCMLCHLWFSDHPSGVRCRETHGNLYYNWRAPNVYDLDDREAIKQRDLILNGMVKKIRQQAFRVIEERSFTRRRHDSRDTATNPLGSTVRDTDSVIPSVGEDDHYSFTKFKREFSIVVDDADSRLAAGLTEISLNDVMSPDKSNSGTTPAIRANGRSLKSARRRPIIVEDEDDEENGGAML